MGEYNELEEIKLYVIDKVDEFLALHGEAFFEELQEVHTKWVAKVSTVIDKAIEEKQRIHCLNRITGRWELK